MEKPDLSRIPQTPGVYLFSAGPGTILYVGKAKNLRRRLAAYFRPAESLPPKTRAMLERAGQVETISTATDNEAFLLEAGLIKKHRPHYNILLRDDKDHLLFRLDPEAPYPRLEIARRAGRGHGHGKPRHFGPFSSAGDAKATWKALHKAFPLRRCTDRGMKNRSRPCLYHHLKQCLAPCVLQVPPEEYAALVDRVILLLEGKSGELLSLLTGEMRRAASMLEYEKAAGLRDQIRAVKHTLEKQAVVLPEEVDLDALGMMENEDGLGLGLLMVRGGRLLGSRNYFWPGLGLENAAELLASFLPQYYAWTESAPPLVLLPWDPGRQAEGIFSLREVAAVLSEQRGSRVQLSIPKGGPEAELIGLASANARDQARRRKGVNLPALLGKAFLLERPVERIEVVDVSHTSGSSTRVGLVVFLHGRPAPDAWRSYAFENNRGDDYAALSAWAARRAAEGPPWPDLLLIDGGKGQLQAVGRALAAQGLKEEFTLAAIAKGRTAGGRSDRRAGNLEDRVFLPGRSNPLNLKPGSEELLFLQHLRNQAHDYALGRHRRSRSNLQLQSELERIPGFGPALIRKLWEKFGSLQAMRQAEDASLLQIPGLGQARLQALRGHLARIIDRE
ncbi:MAG: excinuclease ABC subunit UvrC [Desulfovibrionaceae bacterium]|nr:excinuclease ABC subunit UvrC [Desulfovibrionaceae bacterium]